MNTTGHPESSFENLLVWQRAQALSVEVYRLLSDCRDWGFKDQVTRSANSIADNIAEGCERMGKAEYRYFVSIAKGSAGETRSQIRRAQALQYISLADASRLINELKEISRMLHGLHQKLK
ncbi:MAG: four helix bundle protein [Opitutaceae bacterium]|jgi:four helix bundle protein|nr:four helix bundle protein [Opitutaceae bacterium]